MKENDDVCLLESMKSRVIELRKDYEKHNWGISSFVLDTLFFYIEILESRLEKETKDE